jgi:hypothetical protein
MEWFNVSEIILQLAACFACFLWGKTEGINDALEVLLKRRIITEKDLEKLKD